MKHPARIILFFFIIYYAFLAIREEFGGHEAGFIAIAWSLLMLLLLTSASIIIDTYQYQINRKLLQFTSSFIAVLALCIIFVHKHKISTIERSKTYFSVATLLGEKTLHVDFKENGTFKISEFNPPLGMTLFYGSYSRNYDTIIINHSNYNSPFPKRGIINKDTLFWLDYKEMRED